MIFNKTELELESLPLLKTMTNDQVHIFGEKKYASAHELKKLERESYKYAERKCTEIRGGVILGNSLVVDLDNRVYESSILNLRFQNEKKVVNFAKSPLKIELKSDNLKVSNDLKDKKIAFMLGINGSYQHWFTEILPLFWEYKSKIHNGEIDAVVVNKNVPKYQMDVYEKLGISDMLYFKDPDVACEFGSCFLANPFSVNSMWVSPEISHFYNYLKSIYVGSSVFASSPQKILVSRKGLAKKREVVNWSAVKEFCISEGYEEVFPEEMGFAEKACLFNNASHVVGQGGGGLSNIVFSKPNTKVLSICPNNFPITTFREMASICGLESYYYLAEAFENFQGGRLDCNSIVDPSDFMKMFSESGF